MNTKLKALVAVLVTGVLVNFQTLAQDNEIGMKALDAEKYCLAQETFEKIAGTNPGQGNYYLGQMHLRMGKPDLAKAAFEKGLAADPKALVNKVGIGAATLAKGDRAAGMAILDEIIKTTKAKDLDVLVAAAEACTGYLDANKMKPTYPTTDPAKAIEWIELAKALAIKNKVPARAEFGLIKGDALLVKGEAGPAVSGYEDATSINANMGKAYLRIANIYWGGRNLEQATKYFQNAIDLDADYAPAFREFAKLYFWAKQYKPAAKFMDLFVEKMGKCASDEQRLVATKYSFVAGNNEKVKKDLEDLRGSNEPTIWRMDGWSAFRTGDYPRAAQSMTKFFELAPQKAELDDYKYLGNSLMKVTPTDTAKAVATLEKAAELDTVENGYRDIAKMYQGAKRYLDAAAYFDKSIKRDGKRSSINDMVTMGLMYYNTALGIRPAGADSLNMLARKRDMFKKSIPAFEQAVVKDSNYVASYRYIAGANYYQYSQIESLENGYGIPYYEKFVSKIEKGDDKMKADNKAPLLTAYKILGSYQVLNKKDNAKAIEYMDKVLAIDPNDERTKKQRDELANPTPTPPPAPAPVAKPAPAAKTPAKAPAKKGK
jgi:tetratricopeptide (TPR) repeat protein